jgi:hypothetical protein
VGNGTGNGWEAGPASNDSELTEWFLTGHSTLAAGASIGLGAAYDEVQDAADLVFRYTTDAGVLVIGNVAMGTIAPPSNPADFNNDTLVNAADLTILKTNFGSTSATKLTGDANGDGFTNGADFLVWQRNVKLSSATSSAAAVPEPTAPLLMAIAGVVFAFRARSRTRPESNTRHAPVTVAAMAVVATTIAAATAPAAVTLDRVYRFGDDPAEGAVLDNLAGITFDSQGTPLTGTLHDLSSGGVGPTYVDVSSGPLARPGAEGTLGVRFDGVDDYFTDDALVDRGGRAARLHRPEQSRLSTLGAAGS